MNFSYLSCNFNFNVIVNNNGEKFALKIHQTKFGVLKNTSTSTKSTSTKILQLEQKVLQQININFNKKVLK